MSHNTLDVTFSPDSLKIKDHGSYESRSKSTARMIEEAWQLYRPKITQKVLIHVDDQYLPRADFSYSISDEKHLSKCIPHFLFDAWPEVGISNYQDLFDQLVEAGKTPFENSRVFWIGANTNKLRELACELNGEYPQLIDFRMMSWNRKDPRNLPKHTATYVSLVDHCKYRVLIDLGAGGFSARLPLLLATGRPVILANRDHETWFYWDKTLIPWIHYIPGGSSKQSILEAVKWTFDNPEKAQEIGIQGQQYAKTYLTHDAAIKQLAKTMWNYKEEN